MKLDFIPLSPRAAVSNAEANVICLGNFDGVHLGHRTLLNAALQMRDKEFPHHLCGVFCFREHPSLTLSKAPISLLSTMEQKLESFRTVGIDFVYVGDFAEMRDLSPDDFVRTVLIGECHGVAAVCGFNYHYGKGGSGTAESLQASHIFSRVLVVEDVQVNGSTVSSSRIRALLEAGAVEEAATLLTHPYSLSAPVLHGKALGRQLGAPTVNQQFPNGIQIPRHGVYMTLCEVDGICYRGVSNVGVRPTVDDAATSTVNCETYLLDFSGDLYNKDVTVFFLHFLRPEQKFENRQALIAQIAADIETVKGFSE